MWQEDYLENVTPLPEALVAAGPSTELLSISLGQNDIKKWDRSFAAGIIGSVPTMLEILRDTGFFFLLGKFGTFATGLQTAGLLFPPEKWTRKAFAGGILEPLAPLSLLLAHLTPGRRYHNLWALQEFLQEAEDDDWEGPNCVRYLAAIQQGLEDLEPGRTLNWFEGLHDFLTSHQPYLTWLASHPEAYKKLGGVNYAPMLLRAKQVMDLRMEYYNDCLVDLQQVLENLDEVEAIVPSLDDLDIY